VKAPDFHGLTAEHITTAHPMLPIILNKSFQVTPHYKIVPNGPWL